MVEHGQGRGRIADLVLKIWRRQLAVFAYLFCSGNLSLRTVVSDPASLSFSVLLSSAKSFVWFCLFLCELLVSFRIDRVLLIKLLGGLVLMGDGG